MKVFVDANVLLDVIAARPEFYTDSAAIWTLAERKQIVGLVAGVSFTNIYYIVRRLSSKRKAMTAMRSMLSVFTPIGSNRSVIEQAVAAKFKDFEDAVQYFSALESAVDVIITRNISDFPDDGVCPVMMPCDFLAAHFSDE